MNEATRRLWPFGSRATLVSALLLLVGLVLMVAALRTTLNWPSEQGQSSVFVGILLLSLVPIMLAVIDAIMERGAVIEYGGVKVDFSQSRAVGTTGITVEANIGVRGKALIDSDTVQILAALRQATAADVVIIDLEAGQAWWETRLLVLLAGATRLGKPDKIVFIGMDETKEQCFQGWSYARDLLSLLLPAHPQYERSLQMARSIAQKWELVEPVNPAPTGGASAIPPTPPMIVGTPAQTFQWMVFDTSTGLRNELLQEQVLQSDLGSKVESQEGSRGITLIRLAELFRPILCKDHIDLGWDSNRQLEALFGSEVPFLGVTRGGRYAALASRLALLTEIVKPLIMLPQRK